MNDGSTSTSLLMAPRKYEVSLKCLSFNQRFPSLDFALQILNTYCMPLHSAIN